MGERSVGGKMCPPCICFYLFQGNQENKAANTRPFSSPEPAQNQGIKPDVHLGALGHCPAALWTVTLPTVGGMLSPEGTGPRLYGLAHP